MVIMMMVCLCAFFAGYRPWVGRDPKSDTVRVQLYDTLLTSTPELGFAVLRLSFLVGQLAEQEVTLQMEGARG